MPGINQLGGALVAPATPKAPSGAEGNANAVAQSNADNQVVSTDAVKGPTRATPLQGEGNDEGNDRVRRERRSFQDLAQSKKAAPTPAEQRDTVSIGAQNADEEVDNIEDEVDTVRIDSVEQRQAAAERRAVVNAERQEKQTESKARLKKVMNDLFAPRPRAAQPVAEPAADPQIQDAPSDNG